MFACVLERQHEDGNSVQISTKVKNLSAKTTELVDFLALSDKTNAESPVCDTFWTSREDDARSNTASTMRWSPTS